MSFFEMIGSLLIAAMAALLLRETGTRRAIPVLLGAGLLSFCYLFSELRESIDALFGFADRHGVKEPMVDALRAVGIGYTTDLAGGICRDIGEEAIARRVDAVGRISLLVIALPTLLRLLTLATEAAV